MASAVMIMSMWRKSQGRSNSLYVNIKKANQGNSCNTGRWIN